MNYRLSAEELITTLSAWDELIPVRGKIKVREWKKIYLGVLSPIDLVISKIFRGSEVDIEDSLFLIQKHKLNLGELEKRYKKTAQYDVSETRVLKNLDVLMERLKAIKK